jgi:predicted SnoaL-like aldol condensation-catalyzing enzyme
MGAGARRSGAANAVAMRAHRGQCVRPRPGHVVSGCVSDAVAFRREVSVSDNIERLRRVVEHGFGGGDLAVAEELAGETIIEHEYAAPRIAPGPELLKAMINEARSQVPGLTMTMEDAVAEGDKVWARSIARGVEPDSGNELVFTVFDVCRFADGRIVEHWGVPDRFALLDQLGVLPAPPQG